MEDARPEPSGVSTNNPRPPENTRGNEGHANPPQTNPVPPPATRGNDNPNTRNTNPSTPRLGVKKTKAVLKVATLNIRGGGSANTQDKWQHMNQIMREQRIAILAVQETHLDEIMAGNLNTQFNGRLSIWNSPDPINPSAGKGIAIVLNKHLTSWKEAVTRTIVPGRALLMSLPWQGDSIVNILAIYAPNAAHENADFWTNLAEKWMEENLPVPDIMLGDFNLVEEAIDRLPAHRDNAHAVSKLANFKALHTLRDGWRHNYPTEQFFTFMQQATQSRSRIDRIYVSNQVYNHSRNWSIDHTPIRTDHCLVSMEFANPGAPFIGKGRWSIPLHLIKNRKVIQRVEELGTQLEKDIEAVMGEARTAGTNPQTVFHTFKKLLVKQIRDFSRVETPKMDAQITNLKKDLRTTLNNTQDTLEEIQAKAAHVEERIKQLETLRHKKIRDNLAAKCRLENETISKLWVNMNKERRPRDTITTLRVLESPTERPMFTTKTSEMADLARKYHENLQTDGLSNDVSGEEFEEILNFLEPRLPPSDKNMLATYLTQGEIKQALKKLPDGKAAGIDGIPHELWKTLSARLDNKRPVNAPSFDIVKCLTLVYNDIERHGISQPSEFPKGWMCPLYKKGDKTEISNYRPITVLNTDYKIMTRALTTRLTKAVPTLIHPDQAGFMCGRRIEDQTELVKLMLDNCEASEINGAVVCLDQEKAYDKVRHDFIWKTLEKYDFPKHFINTVKTLYQNGETVIIINGVISKPYKVTRGVRQGDPLSCLIFNLAIESLASMLRSSRLKGLQIPGDTERLITTLFADDTTVFLSEDDDFETLQAILNKWCRASGAKFNVKKTVIIPLGTPEYRESLINTRQLKQGQTPIPMDVKIAAEGMPVRVLGAYIGNGIEQMAVWTPTLEKIDAKLKQWSKNHPTQDGKRLIIGMVVGGLTQFLSRVQGMTSEIETLISRKITKFLWDDASPRVSAQMMSGPIEAGGKKILDIQARNEAIELMKLKSYLKFGAERPRWAKVADSLINQNIPSTQKINDDESKCNAFLQTWTVMIGAKSKLPQSLRKMLKTAKRYGVGIDPPLPSLPLRNQMPIWFHKGQDAEKYPQNNGKWAKCQRNRHKIKTVGEIKTYVTEIQGHRHFLRKNCACRPCRTAREKGCKNPAKCRQSAQALLETLHPKWRPENPVPTDAPQLTGDQLHPNEHAQEQDDSEARTFNPNLVSTPELTKEFRIFVDSDKVCNLPATRPPQEQATVEEGEVTVFLCGAHENQEYDDAKSAFTIWYGDDDSRNTTRRTKGQVQTKEMGECQALLNILMQAPDGEKLHVWLPSPYIRNTLIDRLPKLEDRGWINVPNAEILQTLVAILRARNSQTKIGNLKDKEIVAKITELAKAGLALNDEHEELDLVSPETFQVTGIRLSEASQSMLYQGILGTRKPPIRAASSHNIGITKACVEELTTKSPTERKIWKSLKSKDFPPRIRAFMWKAMHNAYKCGRYWAHIPTCEQRGLCHACENVEESIEHILTECKASGQDEIWKLAEETWTLRGLPWVRPRFGTILGCGLADFHPEDNINKTLTGANRLYAILMSESAHQIWRARCKWRITDGAALDKIPTAQATRETWIRNINRRLQLERLMTDRSKYGKKALKAKLVEKTWWGILRDQESLQDDWLKMGAGVLVGIGERPPGRNR